jgi:hypothetical protein
MEAGEYFLTSLTAGDTRQAAESTQSLIDVLVGLSKCAQIAVELAQDAGSAEASRFANTIYE